MNCNELYKFAVGEYAAISKTNCEQSDFMLYNGIADLHWKFKKEADQQFISQMSQNIARCPIDTHLLNGDLIDPRKAVCNDIINKRGSMCAEPVFACPNKIYNPYLVQEFLLLPCPKPSNDNSLVEGSDKICSKKHQLFRNQTRR